MREQDPSAQGQPVDYTEIPVPGEYRPAPEEDTGTFRIPFEEPTPGPNSESNGWTPSEKVAKKDDPNRFIKGAYVATAGLTLTGFAVFGGQKVLANNNEPEQREGARTAATGPHIPGETTPTQPDLFPESFTERDVPLITKDESGTETGNFTGVEGFATHMQLRTNEHGTIVSAAGDLPKIMTQLVNCGGTLPEQRTYGNYKSKIGDKNGVAGVCEDFYRAAIAQALIVDKLPETAPIDAATKFPRRDLVYGAIITELIEHTRDQFLKNPDYRMSFVQRNDAGDNNRGITEGVGVETGGSSEVHMKIVEEGAETEYHGKQITLGTVMSRQINKNSEEAWMTEAAEWSWK